MEFASELSSLREILSIGIKTQGSTKPAFNKQTQTQANEAKTRSHQTRVLPTSTRAASENQTRA